MKSALAILTPAVLGISLALNPATASASLYQFSFLANPSAGQATADKALDVLHTVTIDSSKIASFTPQTLNSTAAWLGGGITDTLTYAGKTVKLNDAFDPATPTLSVPGNRYEGFLDLSSPNSNWFFGLEFAPGNPFIDSNHLPYDPFVYGFLFAYQDQKAYKDFRDLWTSGKTSVLSQYEVSSVPEPSTAALAVLSIAAGLAAVRRRRQQA